MTLAEALEKSSDLPICWQCAKAEGARDYARSMLAVSMRVCALCEEEGPCTAIRDWVWPKALYRGREKLETK